jgi:hypothetical protein
VSCPVLSVFLYFNVYSCAEYSCSVEGLSSCSSIEFSFLCLHAKLFSLPVFHFSVWMLAALLFMFIFVCYFHLAFPFAVLLIGPHMQSACPAPSVTICRRTYETFHVFFTINVMEQGPFWYADSLLVGKKFPPSVAHEASLPCWTLSWPSWIQSTHSSHTLLSSHRGPVVTSAFFHSHFPYKAVCAFLTYPCVLHILFNSLLLSWSH